MKTPKTTPSEPTGTLLIDHQLVPVYHEGKIQLYDMYVDGIWLGSKRTVKQCHAEIKYFIRPNRFRWWKDYQVGYDCRVEAPTSQASKL